ncbi:MAG: bifunctional diaminohydroxyphosphoribosylaminopyrimidine deaminase/5-amino-6-(5-phosphoribosylamino)uracil reductase RibD, partial [Muribaculaceae bacterium]|nr:bifunctional diaminohydroxyphosphoribosylaminopyrimidine deaminase/5-amino-6-(5-phosphoribosylamino)uracil reductase RibD [Muribaculaceae bacterium]
FSLNRLVGAVLVLPYLTIIGEGYHRKCGEGHAEVNAVADCRKRYGERASELLTTATVYVTLEPCSHYGKTPPCAKLLTECKVKRVVVGCGDPNDKVHGRGINMLREAGIDVTTGVLEDECRELNPRFMTAHTKHRPWITLKWAQSADGYMDAERVHEGAAYRFSTATTASLVHRLRSLHDAVVVGSGTALADRPRLDSRLWPGGRNALRVVLDRRGRINADEYDVVLDTPTPEDAIRAMYERGISSVLVEGGAAVLQSFINAGLYDAVRIEVNDVYLHGGVKAPEWPQLPYEVEQIGKNLVFTDKSLG